MNEYRRIICRYRASFVVLLMLGLSVHIQAYAYEPVIKRVQMYQAYVNPVDHGSYYTLASQINFDQAYDSLSLNWQFYFDYTDCRSLPRIYDLFEASMPAASVVATDRLRLTNYKLQFIPKQGALVLHITVAPDVGGRTGHSQTTYTLMLLDRFEDAHNDGYTFCNMTSPRKLDITLYFNAYNSYIVIRTPANPLGRVLTTSVRVGLGVSMMELLRGRSEDLKFSTYVRSRAGAVPQNSLNVYKEFDAFYWNRLKNAAQGSGSYRNLADDINIFYGSKNFPLRSPVLDRTNAAAAMTELF